MASKVEELAQVRNEAYMQDVAGLLGQSSLNFDLAQYERSLQYKELVDKTARLEQVLVSDFGVARPLLSRLRIDSVREGLLATAYEASER